MLVYHVVMNHEIVSELRSLIQILHDIANQIRHYPSNIIRQQKPALPYSVLGMLVYYVAINHETVGELRSLIQIHHDIAKQSAIIHRITSDSKNSLCHTLF